MPSLHIINKSIFTQASVETALQRATGKDTVLFIEDGVYTATSPRLTNLIHPNVTYLALKDDLDARGLAETIPSVTAIDFDQFVQLTLNHDQVISW